MLRDTVRRGGVAGGLAKVELAELALDHGDETGAERELTELRRSRMADPDPYVMAAEVLAMRGRSKQALRWFEIAVSRYADLELADPDDSRLHYLGTVARQRQVLRSGFGLAPDDLDEWVLEQPASGSR